MGEFFIPFNRCWCCLCDLCLRWWFGRLVLCLCSRSWPVSWLDGPITFKIKIKFTRFRQWYVKVKKTRWGPMQIKSQLKINFVPCGVVVLGVGVVVGTGFVVSSLFVVGWVGGWDTAKYDNQVERKPTLLPVSLSKKFWLSFLSCVFFNILGLNSSVGLVLSPFNKIC